MGWGQLLAVPLDETLTPNADPEVWVELPGGWQDAIGVDACGNVWVPDYFTSALYRISPDGNYEHMVETRERWYGHGIAWGSGIGGWRTDTIYMPQPYNENRVREVVVGVPDGRFVRTFNGVAVGL